MKIAIFSDNFYPEISGISDSVILMGQALARRGHSVHYFAPAYTPANYALANSPASEPDFGPNIKIHRMASLPYTSGTLQGRMTLSNPFRAFFEKEKFDIVHSHNFFAAGIDALMFAKMTRTPLVGTNHTLIGAFIQYSPINAAWVERMLVRYMVWYYNRCLVVTAPARFLCDDMVKRGLKVKPAFLSNPIEAEFFKEETKVQKHDDDAKKNTGKNARPFTVLYAGRLAPEKGVEVLLESFLTLAPKVSDMRLVFVGQGSIRAKLEKRAAESDFASRIDFKGPYMGNQRKSLVEIFHAADIFAIPSTSEIQSMVVLQAMAGGLPTVGVNSGGLPDLIGTDKGILVEPENVQAVAGAILELYKNPELRKKLGDAGRKFAEERHADSIALEWEKIYQKVSVDYKRKPANI